MSEELTQKIQKLIMPCIEDLAVELIELNVRRQGTATIVDLIADKELGGITVDECSRINKAIVRKLEKAQLLGEDFAVEVASPGIDRPLKSAKDFVRATGWNVRFYLREPFEERLEYAGVVKGVKDKEVIIDTPQGLLKLPIERINKAVQIF